MKIQSLLKSTLGILDYIKKVVTIKQSAFRTSTLYVNTPPVPARYWEHFADSRSHVTHNQCTPPTPIIIDIDRNGFHLGKRNTFVEFDYFGYGFASSTQWVASGSDEVFLALDLNTNGIIDDGSELFGSGTWLVDEETWANDSFEALARLSQLAVF